ncbi:MAG TPA: hypothetical protein H9857_04280 [Candidatus Desulfovibrio intestinigallinarum]|nr:hypothetical protein [Candidatus Desulfovibrio intestinigallinarum]
MPVELEKTAVTGYGFARKMRDGRISAGTFSERSAIEKGGTRGGCAAPPGPKRAEKRVFPTKRQAAGFEMHSISN